MPENPKILKAGPALPLRDRWDLDQWPANRRGDGLTVVVKGEDREGTPLELRLGGEIPAWIQQAWDGAIENQQRVGFQHWRQVPSYTELAGFVAGAAWVMYRVREVIGFDVPEPDPKLNY